MAKRAKLHAGAGKPPRRRVKVEDRAGLYFVEPSCEFFSSGCTLLDMALGGGWVEDRTINVVGDKSTGKTLQVVEGAANYRLKYPDARIRYAETEQAFDKGYAQAVGLPEHGVEFPPDMFSVEALFDDLNGCIKSGDRMLYIVDSLDALSDEAELKTKVTDGTYGTSKAKMLSRMFRQLNQRMAKGHMTLMVVSQIRDNIGVMFGKSHTRSGGKALDFYASQVVWLAHLKRIDRTRKGVKRPYGIRVRAAVEKNKVGMPFRKCDYPIYFAFGIEDVVAGIEWLIEVKRHRELFSSEKAAKSFLNKLDKLDDREYAQERAAVQDAVRRVWRELEMEFLPPRRKYQ
jgi:recombination protein RecA